MPQAPGPDARRDALVVAAQLGRAPREPWRVSSRCGFGYPSTIASPGVLADGDRFPTTYWLSCPFLAETAASAESAGACASWATRAAHEPSLAEQLRSADAELRHRRAAESGGSDPLPAVGLAGQRDPAGIKCIHAHVAYALVGIDDPIGRALLAEHGDVCPDERCNRLTEEA